MLTDGQTYSSLVVAHITARSCAATIRVPSRGFPMTRAHCLGRVNRPRVVFPREALVGRSRDFGCADRPTPRQAADLAPPPTRRRCPTYFLRSRRRVPGQP